MNDGKHRAGARDAPAPAEPVPGPTREKASTACRSCQHPNPDGAAFCEECGLALAEPLRCEKCQSAVLPGADICEACGSWLLSGQCIFCYAPMLEGESYCAECGNPAEGLVCPQCAQPSIFDFCKSCGLPLSEQARGAVSQRARDPAMQAVAGLAASYAVLDAAPLQTRAVGATHDDDRALRDAAAALRTYRDSIRDTPAPGPARKAPADLLSATQRARIGQLNDAIAEETRRREEEAERQRLEAERQRIEAQHQREQALRRQRELRDQLLAELRKFAGKTFWSHQEARRFSMSLLSGLPPELLADLKRSGLGWCCNAYDCIHAAPSECADPSKGGVWLLR